MPKLLDWFLRLDVALWGIALAIGIGVTMALAPTIRNVRLAHPFFALAAIWSLASAFQWLANGGEIKMKYILAFVIGGGIFSAALAAFSWVEANHAEHLAVQNPPEEFRNED